MGIHTTVSATIVVDWKDLSEDALARFKAALQLSGLHLGSVEVELYGEPTTDTHFLYIANRKLSKKDLRHLNSEMLRG